METGAGDQIMMVTQQGKIIRMHVDDISIIGRATQGVRLLDVEEADSVVSVARLPEQDEEAETAKPIAAVPDEEEEPIAEEEEEDEAEAESGEEEDTGEGTEGNEPDER